MTRAARFGRGRTGQDRGSAHCGWTSARRGPSMAGWRGDARTGVADGAGRTYATPGRMPAARLKTRKAQILSSQLDARSLDARGGHRGLQHRRHYAGQGRKRRRPGQGRNRHHQRRCQRCVPGRPRLRVRHCHRLRERPLSRRPGRNTRVRHALPTPGLRTRPRLRQLAGRHGPGHVLHRKGSPLVRTLHCYDRLCHRRLARRGVRGLRPRRGVLRRRLPGRQRLRRGLPVRGGRQARGRPGPAVRPQRTGRGVGRMRMQCPCHRRRPLDRLSCARWCMQRRSLVQ